MKRIAFAFIALIYSCNLFSQDVITKINGDEILAKVLEINPSDIKYKRFDNLQGPTYSIFKSDVFSIKYENGVKEMFTVINSDKQVTVPTAPANANPTINYPNNSNYLSNMSEDSVCKIATQDAENIYTGRNSGATITGFTSLLLSPLYGLAPAIICSSVRPSGYNLGEVNEEKMKNPTYEECYTKKARKKKAAKVWTGYIIGSICFIPLYISINKP